MPPIDKQMDALNAAGEQSEIHLALFEDSYSAANDRDAFKASTAGNSESVLNFSPIADFQTDRCVIDDDVKTIVKRKDGQQLEVARSKGGELLGIVFMDYKPESTLRKQNGSWVSEPPLRKGTTIESVAVDAQGTIVLSITQNGEKLKWIHHSDGTEEKQFEKKE